MIVVWEITTWKRSEHFAFELNIDIIYSILISLDKAKWGLYEEA